MRGMEEPRPFLKWVGGKGRLVEAIAASAPRRFGRYHEPFLGGGALFFHLRPRRAVLSDANERLIRTWRAVRDDVEGVIAELAGYHYERGFFLEQRARAIDECPDASVAAWFIYLNRCGFNGLYRVNRANVFNVPFGKYSNPLICDASNLRAVSYALRDVELVCEDFSGVLERAVKGDLVYFDPPYVPKSSTALFTGYTPFGFAGQAQLRLVALVGELAERRVRVLVSNSDVPAVRALYASHRQRPLQVSRALNCKPTGRGKVTELLVVARATRHRETGRCVPRGTLGIE